MIAKALALAAGGLMLAWPAFLNGYPLLFSDSGAFLHQTLGPLMIWDKPWVYGPLILPLHWHRSLWPVVLAQGLVLSHLLWLLARGFGAGAGGGAAPGPHLLLCLVVAALTAAPFSAALVMPDVLTPVAVLCALLLAFARPSLSRAEAAWLAGLGALATAAHLSNLPVMGALAVVALLAGGRAAGRVALPLAAAVALLLLTNLGGHGRLALSPYGATFLLARLVANGPALRTIEAACPAAGWTLCAASGRLAPYGPGACRDGSCPPGILASDVFLWHPDSPVNRDEAGCPRDFGGRALAGEAGAIIRATLAREPLAVALGAVRDTLAQLGANGVGDTLGLQGLEGPLAARVSAFGPAELARFRAGAQWREALAGRVAPVLWVQGPVLALAAAGLALLGWRGRRDRAALGLALGLGTAVLANAFATGTLSGPHDRYGARLAWVLVAGAVVLAGRPRLSGGGRPCAGAGSAAAGAAAPPPAAGSAAPPPRPR
ncbi:hypothetical protein EAH89_06710 [Roseomonas nepalensis]|uniref:Glycosyltransferase RgtA/B/C/D-like domain-containing protein n=1 Tax=Muricoccus nepalensis TaxID=1854500 RepID=A0A502GEA4_9PROT|nr:hypothetical protein [Roseomonas nepalensis]TPG59043.1 hypothetical protein EAH89_06710 [Roseomonas nepalensis]